MKPATYKRIQIRTLRELRGPFSQREVADIIGMKPEGYQQWELGTAQPSPPSLRKLLDHYATWKKHFGQDPKRVIDEVLDLVFPQIVEEHPTEGE